MIDRAALVNRVKSHEGYSRKAYRDTVDVLTVGWGTNISFVEDEARHIEWLNRDIDNAIAEATKWLGDVWETTSPARQSVVAELAYQLGMPRLSLFQKFRAAMLAHEYGEAAVQLRNSRLYEQTPVRTGELAAIIEHG